MKYIPLILLLMMIYSLKSYSCTPPTAPTAITISGPSTVSVGTNETFTATASDIFDAQPPHYFGNVRIAWKLVNSTGAVIDQSIDALVGTDRNGPYQRSFSFGSSLNTGSYQIEATLSWDQQFWIGDNPTVTEFSISDAFPIVVGVSQPSPDLEVVGQVNGNSANESSNIVLQYAVVNSGDPLSSSIRTNVRAWWSLNTSINPNQDRVAATISNVEIQNGSSFNFFSTTVQTPVLDNFGLSGSGWNFYLLLEVDYTNSINEPNGENNNVYDDILLTINEVNPGGRIGSTSVLNPEIANIGTGVMTVFPNPTSGSFEIKNTSGNLNDSYNLIVTDVMGNIIFNRTVSGENSEEVDLSSYDKGIYIIRKESVEGIEILRVIKN